MRPKIVILDGKYANPGDLSWDSISKLGDTTLYDQTTPEEVVSRSAEAEILIVNKIRLGKAEFSQLPMLKLVCITATGTDNVNLNEAGEWGIQVRNAVGYSTNSVAQHVFALILHFTNRASDHSQSVHFGNWDSQKGFSYTLDTIPDLSEMSIGIYGFGKIGKRIAELANAFGMKVLVTSQHTHPKDFPDYRFADLHELFSTSDFISLHAPLTGSNLGLIDRTLLSEMKSNAILINTARGGLINEQDLFEVLTTKKIRGAALDVLISEPPGKIHPFFTLPNCLITPHLAWTTLASRRELIKLTSETIKRYLNEKRPS